MIGTRGLIAPAHQNGGQNFDAFNPVVAIIIYAVKAVLLSRFCLALPILYIRPPFPTRSLEIENFAFHIPIICQGVSVRRPYLLKRMKIKISKYGLYITKTVYYEVSCDVVVGRVVKATVDQCLDPAGALCELLPKLTAKGALS